MLLIYRKDLRNQQTSISINMKLITLTKESYLPGILNGNIRSRQKVCDKHCRLLKGPLWGQSHISGYRKWSNAPLMVHRKEYCNALPTKYFLQKRGEKGWSLGRNSDGPQHTLWRPLRKTWKEGADDLSAAATLPYKPLAIKAGAGRLKAKQQKTNRF